MGDHIVSSPSAGRSCALPMIGSVKLRGEVSELSQILGGKLSHCVLDPLGNFLVGPLGRLRGGEGRKG